MRTAHEGLVEGHLAAVGRGAQRIGLDLEHGNFLHRHDGGGATAGGAGEIEHFAEAAARLDGVSSRAGIMTSSQAATRQPAIAA